MERKIYLASCPVCGRALFKGTPHSYIEGGCPKCKNYVQVEYTTEGVRTHTRAYADMYKENSNTSK